MASHGGGKVYFILYLAVLLELLIIIVERDDAEEELKKEKEALVRKNKRIQLIAETIINALRGSQTSVSSTSDQTMTLGDPKEPEREFSVKVRVSDPTRDSVNDLSLTILRNDAKMDSIEMTHDTSMFPRVQMGQDYLFKYKFKPTFGEGTYRLRFNARTNQIVGVSQSHSPDDTVKIGAVHLTVGELEEVKNNITENVALKGFIDSLLTGNFANFSTNLGNNEFIVNVKRPEAKVTDQLNVIPQVADFSAFPTLNLPNPIKIQGADPKGVKLQKIDGPGDIVQVGDTNWVWQYTPSATDVGQTYTVHFKGQANRGGGAKDIGSGSFSVLVKALKPVGGDSAVFAPIGDDDAPHAYTKFPFRVNGKFADLDGQYQVKISVDGKEVVVKNEPTAEYTPVYLQDEGKKLSVQILYKSVFSREYTVLKTQDFTVESAPLLLGPIKNWNVGDNPQIQFLAGIGLESSGSDYQSELPGDLTVSSEPPVMDTKAVKGDGFKYTIRVLKPPTNVKRDGMMVNVTFTDPKSGQSKSKKMMIYPKKK